MDTSKLAEKLRQPARSKDDDDDYAGMTVPMKIDCTLPDGRDPADLDADELARVLVELGIPGARKSNSKEASVALYKEHLRSTFAEGRGNRCRDVEARPRRLRRQAR